MVGVGTNFSPRDRTSVSEDERGSPERLITVLVKVSVFGVGVVVGKGPWEEGEGILKEVRAV
jgi:hypothetical protein